MSDLRIRSAKIGDAERLVELIVDLGHPITLEKLRANMTTLVSMGLDPIVAETGGRVVALCVPSIMQVLHRDTPVGRISTTIVDPAYRGAGLGALMVTEAERRLSEAGCALVEVTSNNSRDRAHRFYEKLGYVLTSKRFAKAL